MHHPPSPSPTSRYQLEAAITLNILQSPSPEGRMEGGRCGGVGDDLAPEALPGLGGTPRLLWETPFPGLWAEAICPFKSEVIVSFWNQEGDPVDLWIVFRIIIPLSRRTMHIHDQIFLVFHPVKFQKSGHLIFLHPSSPSSSAQTWNGK